MPRKPANMRKMPAPLPPGLILEDTKKQKWVLGSSIGKGGFGEIYCAQEYTNSKAKKSGDYPYVVKVEPHDNGPLFCEMHVYMRIGKVTDVENYKSEKNISRLGMPTFFGAGSHVHDGENYRFIVLQKFGVDIWKLFLENNRQFPTDTVFKLGVQMLDVLEYIHGQSYMHGDIKGANILLGPPGPEAESQVYLVDFGLASHYDTVYKGNKKNAHNGTIEYLSRDAHFGVESRRGDLEILVYNLIQWLGCVLPWENNLKNVKAVQESKEKYMENLPQFLKDCFGDVEPPDAIVKYLKYIASLKFETDPDYKKLRSLLINGVETAGGSLHSQLKFSKIITPQKRKGTVKKASAPGKKAKLNQEADEVEEQSEGKKLSENGVLKTSNAPKKTSKKGVPKEVSNGNLNKIENKIKTSRKTKDEEETDPNGDDVEGYTAEMLRIKSIKNGNKQKSSTKKNMNSNDRIMRPRRNVNYAEKTITENDG